MAMAAANTKKSIAIRRLENKIFFKVDIIYRMLKPILSVKNTAFLPFIRRDVTIKS
jgi:hypothetical protein